MHSSSQHGSPPPRKAKDDALVRNEDLRLLQERPRDREPLALPARELSTARTDLRVKAARERVDEAAVGEAGGLLDLGAGGRRAAVGDCAGGTSARVSLVTI